MSIARDNLATTNGAIFGTWEVVRLLLADERVDPSADNNLLIREAENNNRVEIVKLLLADERVDPASNNNYAVRVAREKGYFEVVELLLNDPRVNL